jgi:hypothetical protein
MKKLLSGIAFLATGVLVSQCDEGWENPHYPDAPSIQFTKLKFIEVAGANIADTLKLTINYKDGDSDLGVAPDEQDEPFHPVNYFLEDGSGDTTKVATQLVFTSDDRPYFLLNPVGFGGKLVTDRTRNKPNYGYLPVYDEHSCLNYTQIEMIVPAANADDSYNILDTLFSAGNMYLLIEDYVLYELNPYASNLHVGFEVFDNGEFREFDWLENYCFEFSGRFPEINKRTSSIKTPPFYINPSTPWEGKITYNMVSTGFLPIFSVKTMRLKIMIYDRNLHASETIYTPSFTLDGIRPQ